MSAALKLSPALLADWKTCGAFARMACAGRGCSHNHTHMQLVTESALLISSLEGHSNNEAHLRRIIHVAMLHDVADHKYEKVPGQLTDQVNKFIETQFSGNSDEISMCRLAIEAISFSKEKKRGKRWFVEILKPEWLIVRDIVSDADKLYAIGVDGLMRAWIYGLEMMAEAKNPPEMDLAWHVKRIIEHGDEKLLKLKDEYVVTESGKMLAEPRHHDMVEILDEWKQGMNLPTGFDAPFHW